MRQNVVTSARLIEEEHQKWKKVFITLTYRPGAAYSPRQISSYLRSVREWLRRRRISCHYVWVMELTRAGKPHYHVIFWLPWQIKLPKPDTGQWNHGSSQIQLARNPVSYLAKYASKLQAVGFTATDLRPPKGARISGNGGLSVGGRIQLRWWLSPAWLKHLAPIGSNVRRTVSGYLCTYDDETIEFFPSPYRVDCERTGIWLSLKEFVYEDPRYSFCIRTDAPESEQGSDKTLDIGPDGTNIHHHG